MTLLTLLAPGVIYYSTLMNILSRLSPDKHYLTLFTLINNFILNFIRIFSQNCLPMLLIYKIFIKSTLQIIIKAPSQTAAMINDTRTSGEMSTRNISLTS